MGGEDDMQDERAKAREVRRLERERLRNEEKNKRRGAQLRANLTRRKAQTRALREGEEDQRDEGIAAARPKDES